MKSYSSRAIPCAAFWASRTLPRHRSIAVAVQRGPRSCRSAAPSKRETHRQRDQIAVKASGSEEILIGVVQILVVAVVVPTRTAGPVLGKPIANRPIRLIPGRVQRTRWDRRDRAQGI